MTLTETLWRTLDSKRHFVIPDSEPRHSGSLVLRSLVGANLHVDPEWSARFEVSEAEVRVWARQEFGFMLDQMRQRIGAKLARERDLLDATRHAPVAPESAVTPDAVPAAFDLLRKLPHAILDSLSGDPARVEHAKDELVAVEQRLGAAGVNVGPKLCEFPSRLAMLRREFEATRKSRDERQR